MLNVSESSLVKLGAINTSAINLRFNSKILTFYIIGGEDFDQRVMEHFIKIYKKKTGNDIRSDNRAVQKLRREVEKAKRTLSTAHQARIEIESFYKGEDFSETLTRAKFEELNMVSFHCREILYIKLG